MAIQSLSEEQISTWTRQQKDEWWFNNVFRGDMAQLTFRSGVTGFLLGGILSATALYVAGKTGVTIGVGLTSVILSFALFRALNKAGLTSDYTILENNCTQSIATASGYMVTALASSLAAYMVVTGKIIPWWQMMIFMSTCAILGVLIAFPMKRKFINEDQLPFPEGRACGVVLDSLYTGNADSGVYKAKLVAYSSIIAALFQMIVSDGWMKLFQIKIFMMDKWLGLKEAWNLNEMIDAYYYEIATKMNLWIPTILGTDIRTLGLRFSVDLSMIGIGGLMGIRVASSLMLGAVINFVFLAPWMIQIGDIAPRVLASGAIQKITRAEIVNQWSLWWGVTMMVVGSLVGLLANPKIFTNAYKALFGKKAPANSNEKDVLKNIEVPLWISYIGVPVFSVLGASVTHYFFDVPWLLSFISLPLIFVLAVICTNSMALTSWTPTGALSKITQFSMGAIDRANPASNLIPAAMTAEISANAANLLSDIKPGYMLGGKPRHQAIGHVIGIFAGVICAVPLFYLLFLPPDANGIRSTTTIISEQFSMPGATQWKGVAEIIAKGVSGLPTTAVIAMIVAALAAIAFELARIFTKGRFPISSVSVGLGVVLPPAATFMMWLGALLFWWMGRKHKAAGTKGHTFWVEGCEPICAGLITGAALIGIGNAILNVLI